MKPRNSTLASRSDGHPHLHRYECRIPTTNADATECAPVSFADIPPGDRCAMVDTPPTQASWITATSAFSDVLRGSKNGGK